LCISYIGLFYLRDSFTLEELVRMIAATITSMVPQGLVLMATLALLVGALTMSRKGAVVNRLAAVEAMAEIDTLCMDKTGTLTTNQLRLMQVKPVGKDVSEDAIRHRLALFASCSMDRKSKSLQALREALGEPEGELLDQLPFKSQNRYSAVRVRAGEGEHTLALGAFEAVRPFCVEGESFEGMWQELAATGWRLLLFAETTDAPRATFDGSLEGYQLKPLAFVALGDDLRPEASGVLAELAEQQIAFKILSGDNPDTVRATVAPLGQASLAHDPVISGIELEKADNAPELFQSHSVFGRISPWQKVQIVRGLLDLGRKVAMIGDGVNDVLSIKNASLGIAMGDGSRASKTVAGLVLTNNDFGLLPRLLDEGRIIVRNLRRSGKLFLTKNVYTLILIIGTIGIFNIPFPFEPQQVTLLNLLTIGVPALLITLDRQKAEATQGDYVREVGGFALHTGIITGVATLSLMLVSARVWKDEKSMQHTMVLTTLVLLGWVTLWRVLRGVGHPLLRWLPLPGLALYLLALYVPRAREFLELQALSLWRWGIVLGVVVIAGAIMWVWDRVTASPLTPNPSPQRARGEPEKTPHP
jgi:cation-transporting ATPase E